MSTALLPDMPGVETFGAPKVNYDEPEDPETDLDAAEYNGLAATAAAVAMTAPRCVLFVAADGTLTGYRAVWGDSPALAPVIFHPGTGAYSATFASSYPDLLGGGPHPFVPRGATGSSNFSGAVWQRAEVSGSTVSITMTANGSFTAVIY